MRSERGQSTVEWIALVLLAALLLVGVLAVAGRILPGGELAREILGRIVCAVRMGGCGGDGRGALALAYGEELAEVVREEAPDLLYEEEMVALPVDFRRCREPACSDGAATGLVTRSASGEPVAAFVHVVDCREPALAESREAGYDCSGAAAGNVYVQYFFYYPTSSSWPIDPTNQGFHEDDWESWHLRIEPGGRAYVRASSHHGYNYEFSKLNVGSDAGGGVGGAVNEAVEAIGARPRGGWGPATGELHVSGGSHAGNAKRDDYTPGRTTPGGRFELIPIESLSARERAAIFEVVPPWRKPVYSDPESEET
ncbi:MAG TPA: hypothetical protein VFY99_03915 [Solirubrobacterales bacterium]